jgi:hypothetical protein
MDNQAVINSKQREKELKKLPNMICKCCNKEYVLVDDCTANRTIEYVDGEILPASIFIFPEHIRIKTGKCFVCGIKPGNYHHPGCDAERCPRCEGQLNICDCKKKV